MSRFGKRYGTGTNYLLCIFIKCGLTSVQIMVGRIASGELYAGSRVVRIDLLHFLAGCHKKRLNQALPRFPLMYVLLCC